MYNFPNEILNAKKIFTIAIDEDGELIFNIDQKDDSPWTTAELIGCLYFADKTVKNGNVLGDLYSSLQPVEEIPEVSDLQTFPEVPPLTEREERLIEEIKNEIQNEKPEYHNLKSTVSYSMLPSWYKR